MADLASVSKPPLKIITDERCVAYHRSGHPERPQRISGSLEFLRNQRELALDWLEPSPVADEAILRAHTPEFLASVTKEEEAFDGDTPTYPAIIGHARRAVGARC